MHFQCRAADPLEWWLLRHKWLLAQQTSDSEWQERELGRCQRNIVALLKLRTGKRKALKEPPLVSKASPHRLRGHNAHYYEPYDKRWASGIPGKKPDPDLGKY